MKKLLSVVIGITLLSSACEKKVENKNPGTVEFAVNLPQSTLKSTGQDQSSEFTYAVVTIKDNSGNIIYNNEELAIYKMGDTYITKPLSLQPGSYELTGFMLSDDNKTITYATPYKDSNLSYLVNNPLPIKLIIAGDEVLKISPEVISAENTNPTEFGYSTFSFDVVKTFKINVAVFIFNYTSGNYDLTSASLKVQTELDSKSFTLELGDSTNHILIPEKESIYNLEFSKSGYTSKNYSFTLEQLKVFVTKPLIVTLDASSSMVLHLPFNNNVLDYSSMNNHGILEGAVPTADRDGNENAAYNFDGNNDYVKVPNAPSLNPLNAITVSAWYKTTPFVGSGNDGLVNKGFTSHVLPYYQYQLGVGGSNYWNGHSGFGFSIALDDDYKAIGTGSDFYELNKWYHVVGTYDGSYLKLYVNGELINSVEASGSMKDYGSDLFIGRHGNKSEYYNTTFHLPGCIDDVRIYNKALSADEISNLYQE